MPDGISVSLHPRRRIMDDDLIEQIYDAALDGDLWSDALSSIAAACGAVSVSLFLPTQDPTRDVAGLMMSRGSEESHMAYARHWWQHDVIAQTGIKMRRRGLSCDWLTIDPHIRARHPFYQDFRRSFDLRDNVAWTMEPEPGFLFRIALQLPLRATTPPDAATVDRFTALGRHASRAILFDQRMARTGESSDVVSGLMATLSCGIACLDGEGHVILANPALEGFARDGLRIVKSRLATANAADQAGLDRLIRGALTDSPSAGQVLAQVSRPSGRVAFLVGVLPISAGRQERHLAAASSCRAVVTVIDPDAGAGAKAEPALRSLNLSPAEARLAALVGTGFSPREAAERLGITEGTARTRLKQIFDKLGLSRQSELARLVTQLTLFKSR